MSSYLEEELANISRMKMDLEQKQSEIQKQIELELEKNIILELDGTIEKLQVQINELSKEISGNIFKFSSNTHSSIIIRTKLRSYFR